MRSWAVVGTVAVATCLVQLPASATTTGPHITVTPNNVMVNTVVAVKGTGFPKSASLVIKECGATSWSIPQHPCLGAIHVQTGPRGGFYKRITAKICPRTYTGNGPVTEVHCYVGEPKPSGVDTLKLVGHASLTVTYP